MQRLVAIISVAALAIALCAGPAVANTEKKWKEWMSQQVEQFFIEKYADEKGLDPATLTYDDLPNKYKKSHKSAFGSKAPASAE